MTRWQATGHAGLIGLAALLSCGCGGRQAETTKPALSLSSTPEAQRDFRTLREGWRSVGPAARGQLLPRLRSFVARYPDDGRTPLVRVYLALALLEGGEVAKAKRALAPLADLPSGTARDLARVARALVLMSSGDPTGARRLLEPLRGKLIGADERLLYGELLVKSALAEQHLAEAVLDMRWWLTEVEPADVPDVKTKVLGVIANFDRQQLEEARVWLSQQRPERREELVAIDEWLARQVTDELARSALRTADAALARRLVDLESNSFADQETRQRLSRLASSGELARRVVGRTLGLVLSLGNVVSSRRGSQVSAGIMRGLGLPRAERTPNEVQLLIENDTQGMRSALADLAGGGASILVAGVDAAGANEAVKFAEEAAIPVITLALGDSNPAAWQYAFSLASSEEQQRSTLASALAQQGIERWEVFRPDLGTGCASAVRAGQPRFPLAEWKQKRLEGLVLMTDQTCGRDLIQVLTRTGRAPLLALGLEAAPLVDSAELGSGRIGLGAGRYPDGTPEAGVPGAWFEALGMDAARLARSALRDFPSETVDDARVVAELHTRARDQLLSASVRLVTSNGRGFEGQHQLPRQLHLLESSGRNRP